MTISYPVSLPASPAPKDMEWAGMTVIGKSVSPYTLSQETFEWPGNRWRVTVRYPAMTRAQADPIIAALISLWGVGTFFLGPTGPGKSAKGLANDPANGNPLVDGANQSGKTLLTKAWNASLTGVFKAADYFQLGTGSLSRLHMVLLDANSDGVGKSTLDIWPRIRESPADGSAIVVASPKGVFRLIGNEPIWEIDEGYIHGLTFEAEEAL